MNESIEDSNIIDSREIIYRITEIIAGVILSLRYFDPPKKSWLSFEWLISFPLGWYFWVFIKTVIRLVIGPKSSYDFKMNIKKDFYPALSIAVVLILFRSYKVYQMKDETP